MSNYRTEEQQRAMDASYERHRLNEPLYAEIDALKRRVKRLRAERDALRLKLAGKRGAGKQEVAK